MELAFEMIREAGVRMPGPLGGDHRDRRRSDHRSGSSHRQSGKPYCGGGCGCVGPQFTGQFPRMSFLPPSVS